MSDDLPGSRAEGEDAVMEESAPRSALEQMLGALFGWDSRRRPGSKARAVMSRMVVYLTILCVIEACWVHRQGIAPAYVPISILLPMLALLFFVVVVLAVPLMTTQDFQPSSRRLFGDALLSSVFMILAFSHVYRVDGLSAQAQALDFVYFSAVTFSTLGFGDYAPVGTIGRLGASGQALLGNLHLAIIVAALFLRVSRRNPPTVT